MRVKGTPIFPLAVCIWWFGFLLLFPFTFAGFQPYENFVYNAYFWLLTGILFSLPRLNEQSAVQPETGTRVLADGIPAMPRRRIPVLGQTARHRTMRGRASGKVGAEIRNPSL